MPLLHYFSLPSFAFTTCSAHFTLCSSHFVLPFSVTHILPLATRFTLPLYPLPFVLPTTPVLGILPYHSFTCGLYMLLCLYSTLRAWLRVRRTSNVLLCWDWTLTPSVFEGSFPHFGHFTAPCCVVFDFATAVVVAFYFAFSCQAFAQLWYTRVWACAAWHDARTVHCSRACS